MRMHNLRGVAALTFLLAAAGCSKKAEDNTSPLAFVPADTPYINANIEPAPDAAIAQWQQQMQVMWPILVEYMDHAIAEIDKKGENDAVAKVVHAVFDEVRTRDTIEKWGEVGLGPKARAAIYGVGLLPVARLELLDPDAFRAMLTRIEQKGGQSFATTRIGEQEVRTFGGEDMLGLIAIEGRHLVIALVPAKADEALKRRVLGLDRPAKSLADSGALADFNKTRGYLPYGSGYVDTHRLVALFAEAAKTGDIDPAKEFDETCRTEFDALATKAPMLAFGYTKFDSSNMTVNMRLDLEPALAKSLGALATPLPGNASTDALIDFAFALPILRGRDFLVAQADAVEKAPFRCKLLASMNQGMAEMKQKLDQVIPPPVADLSGARLTISHFSWAPGAAGSMGTPDVAGTLVVGSANPSFLVNLAKLTSPALTAIDIGVDGKPVALPDAALPPQIAGKADIHVAMGAKALGVALGKDEAPKLQAAVTTVAPTSDLLMQTRVRGEFYTVMGDMFGQFGAMLPAESRVQLEMQRKMYAMYAQWFDTIDVRFATTPQGLEFSESIALKPH
jgi:hypothetical protein